MLLSIIPAKLRSLEPFDDKDWLFELKHDGFRSLAYLENGQCRLVSRRRNTYKSFEVLKQSLSGLKARSAILDGEIVALDPSGVSQFEELLYRRGRAIFCAFDLLWLNNTDLRQTPLIERKKKLRRLIEGSERSQIIYAQQRRETENYCSRRSVSGILRGSFAYLLHVLRLHVPRFALRCSAGLRLFSNNIVMLRCFNSRVPQNCLDGLRLHDEFVEVGRETSTKRVPALLCVDSPSAGVRLASKHRGGT